MLTPLRLDYGIAIIHEGHAAKVPLRARGTTSSYGRQHLAQLGGILGTVIGRTVSHYTIQEKLGAGGMGVVYKATDLRLGRTVALKFLPPDLTRSDDAKERFIREAQSASALDHPNICTIYDFDETDDQQLFFAMAFYEGETLKSKLARGPLPVFEAVEIALQIARGLLKAHQLGIVHRDVKPANIMLTPDRQIKILDFGLAKLAGNLTLTRPGSTVGSPAYMSPEQIRGTDVDHRTDIWSHGVVLYEMVSGSLPFRGESDRALFHAILEREPEPLRIAPELAPILKRCLAKSPPDRYADMAELSEDLKRVGSRAESLSSTMVRPEEQPLASIGVLPFADMSPARDQEYFCEGVAEEILNSLTQIEGLRVASRTSSFQFKGSAHDVRKIGEQLRVNTVLEGSVRKAGDRLRVTVQLINVADGYHLWSKRYDSQLQDIFQIQDEIAQNTAAALEPLLRGGTASVRKAPRTDLEAYDYYLRGRKLYEVRGRSLDLAREMFERSAKCDPNYALAYTGIADCSAWLFMWFTGDPADLKKADAASRRALELAPDLAEAHVSRGWALSLGKNYEEAAAEFEQAIQRNPNLFDAWYLYGRTRFAQNRPGEAVRLFLKAAQIQPDDFQTTNIAAMAYEKLGQSEEARRWREESVRRCERRLQIDPHDARAMNLEAEGLLQLGRDPSRADELIQRSLAEDPEDRAALYNAACFYSVRRDFDRALEYLEQAIAGRPGFFKDWIDHDPDWEPLRNDPRFRALVSRLH